MNPFQPDRRAAPRAAVELGVTLTRAKGSPIDGHTVDLGAGGTRVFATRPLHVDEVLTFSLPLPGERVDGHARVLREYSSSVYALRFENLADEAAARLSSFIARIAA